MPAKQGMDREAAENKEWAAQRPKNTELAAQRPEKKQGMSREAAKKYKERGRGPRSGHKYRRVEGREAAQKVRRTSERGTGHYNIMTL